MVEATSFVLIPKPVEEFLLPSTVNLGRLSWIRTVDVIMDAAASLFVVSIEFSEVVRHSRMNLCSELGKRGLFFAQFDNKVPDLL